MRTSATQPPVTLDVSQPGSVGVQVFGTFRPAPGCRQLPPGPVTQTNVGDGWVGSVVGTPGLAGGVTAPSLVSKIEPEYSEEARKAKYQGTVLLYIQVDASGKAINMRVLHSLGLGLDEKAMEAVKKWKFKPGTKDGKAVTVEAQIEVNFRLL